MGVKADLSTKVTEIFKSQWTVTDGKVIPEPADLKLTNDARKFDAITVLYADLSDSTAMVDTKSWNLSAEVYKTYLHCAATLIRSNDGEITAYDGDRVMAVFLGGSKNSNAVRCGLQINWAVRDIINPALKAQYPTSNF